MPVCEERAEKYLSAVPELLELVADRLDAMTEIQP